MEHDDSIDFIKGISILLVITFHCIGGLSDKFAGVLTLEQGVPLFLIVSSFLYFKSNKNKLVEFYKKRHFFKFFNRIFFPFFIFQIPIIFISYLKTDIGVYYIISYGGIGKGTYYPWLYFQLWILFPCFLYLIRHKKIKLWHAIAISIIIEIAFNQIASLNVLSDYSELAWRLFVGRYVFSIYIGFLLAENNFNFIKFAPLTLIGLIITLLQRYDIWNSSLLYYTPSWGAWKGVHWQMYFYTASLFILLKASFAHLPGRAKTILKWAGQNSWEIFLSQMLFFQIFNLSHFSFINPFVSVITFITFSIVASIIIAMAYLKLKNMIFSVLLTKQTI